MCHYVDPVLSSKWFLELIFLTFDIFQNVNFCIALWNRIWKESVKHPKNSQIPKVWTKNLAKYFFIKKARKWLKNVRYRFSWVLHYTFLLFHLLKVARKKSFQIPHLPYISQSHPDLKHIFSKNYLFCSFWEQFWGLSFEKTICRSWYKIARGVYVLKYVVMRF